MDNVAEPHVFRTRAKMWNLCWRLFGSCSGGIEIEQV